MDERGIACQMVEEQGVPFQAAPSDALQASEAVKRIVLPSGGWWDLTTRPRWKHVRRWASERPRLPGDSRLVEVALACLTTAWSFAEEVSPEAVADRDAEDLVVALEEVGRVVARLVAVGDPEALAQELFAGAVAGQIPPLFAEAHLMAATGWSWHTLQETPADVVQTMAIYLAVEQTRDIGGTLDIPDEEASRDDG